MYTNIIIKSGKESVKKSFLEYLRSNQVEISSTETHSYFQIGEVNEGVTIIHSSRLPIPKLLIWLSTNLNTKVITLGYADINSAVHYSEIENGILKKVFTYSDGLIEKENIEALEVFNTATSKKQFNIRQGMDMSEEGLEGAMNESFFNAYSEIDILEAFDSVESWDSIYIPDTIVLNEYFADYPTRNWKELL